MSQTTYKSVVSYLKNTYLTKNVSINKIIVVLFLILILPLSYADNIPKNQTKIVQTESSGNISKSFSHRHKVMVVLLLVDDETFRFHGRENIELYSLTLMSLVDEAFHHPSLGVSIEIWLRKVHYLTIEQSSKISFQKDLSKTLDSFCRVAQSVKKKSYSKDRIDAFILLTRKNFGPSGYAPVGSVCSPDKNCLMVQDKGFSSAYVIAHELGHTLGMNHDGEKNKCRRWGSSIMAVRVLSNFYNHFWSTCSRNSLAETLVEATCLDESPGVDSTHVKTFRNYTYAHAIKWSHHQQCRQTFGSGFWGCPHILEEYMCQSLSCKNYDSYSGGCVTKDFPALPETLCGASKWCKDSKCSRITNKREVVEWSGWQAWSSCSRSCGVGFQKRSRVCTKTGNIRHGRKCRGPAEEFRACNTHACAEVSDFRAEQCREFNDDLHHWVPFENENKVLQCKLSCKSEETGVEMIEDTKDGTFCSYENPNNRCFEGSCKELGCDGIINSKVKENKCGICGGNNKDCIKVLKHVSLKLSANEYHELGVFPKYAKNIAIKERSSTISKNQIFSLRDTISNKWFLNESQNMDGPQKFVANGALFTYTNHYSGKYFKAEGPLTDPLSLMVLSTSTDISVDFQYKFYLPKKVHNNLTLKKFYWRFSHWSACSKNCDGGYQYKVFECVRKRKKVSQGKCAYKALPLEHRVCNVQPCSLSYWWSTRPLWTPCSVSCGVGVQISIPQCMGREMDQVHVVDDELCKAETKVTGHRECFMLPCMTPRRRKKRVTQYKNGFINF